ncbi:MAG: thioesterase family protein [Alphaproteobacteria bacterium]
MSETTSKVGGLKSGEEWRGLPHHDGRAVPLSGTVPADWFDAAGDARLTRTVATYTEIVAWPWLRYLGAAPLFRHDAAHGSFGLDTHFTYDATVALTVGEPFRIDSQLLGFDAKRLHFIHLMRRVADETVFTTFEMFSICVHKARRKVEPMPAEVLASIDEVWRRHRVLPRPEQAAVAIAPVPMARPAA